MKCIKLILLDLTVHKDVGLPVAEVAAWIHSGMQDHCEFDYAELEECRHTEELYIFKLRILMEKAVSDAKSHKTVMKALKEYCDFDEVTLDIAEVHDALWVNDDFSLADTN